MLYVLSVAAVLGLRQENRFQGGSRWRKEPDLVGLECQRLALESAAPWRQTEKGTVQVRADKNIKELGRGWMFTQVIECLPILMKVCSSLIWVWWPTSEILESKKWRQKDQKFKVILSHIVS